METLLYETGFDGIVYLKDARGNLIGRFNNEADAIAWCKENGYHARKK